VLPGLVAVIRLWDQMVKCIYVLLVVLVRTMRIALQRVIKGIKMDDFDREIAHAQRVQQHNASLLNPKWEYVPASKTDIRKTWAKFGFKPPSEQKVVDKH